MVQFEEVPGKCNSCGARIRWVLLSDDSVVPLDDLPHPAGIYFAYRLTRDGSYRAWKVSDDKLEGMQMVSALHRSHLVTCPSLELQSGRIVARS